MKILIQRVSGASVKVEGQVVGLIKHGFVIFIGITHDDTENEARFLADKAVNLRVFEDQEGKMNLSLKDVGGEALVVSQFTLYGDAQKGRRPSFTEAARPEKAIPLYELFVDEMKAAGINTSTGIFAAKMEVEIHNSGPVTIMIQKP